MTAAEVTVAVCTRNRAEELQRCLASLRELDPPPGAVVVADQSDGEAAARGRALCAGLATHLTLPPRGLGASRQAVLESVATPVVAFTDDDCVAWPGWVGAIAAAFARHPDAGAVTGPMRPRADAPLPEGVPSWVTDWGGDREERIERPRDPATIGGGLDMAFRVAALRRVGGFDPLLGAGAPLRGAEDADAFHRLLLAGMPVVYTPDAVVSHRPPRDRGEHERNERQYGFGLGAWAARRRLAGDALPLEFWWAALRRTLSVAVRHAPADGPRRTIQRLRIAWNLGSGRLHGARHARASVGAAR